MSPRLRSYSQRIISSATDRDSRWAVRRTQEVHHSAKDAAIRVALSHPNILHEIFRFLTFSSFLKHTCTFLVSASASSPAACRPIVLASASAWWFSHEVQH